MRFECQAGCTTCCQRRGFVYLTEDDIVRAARFLGMTARVFEKRYVYRTRNLRRLRIPRGSLCRFLRADGCAIHPAKPTQCRLFPFWPELTEKSRAWRRTSEWCPGIGKGELVQIETVRKLAGEMRAAYPSLYP
ncbi:MAG TPA: YkgJ family cysteine cluster protein [Bryobacteraceae bacterium]|nr:YkgJ family cysteine cluster protein [Bryobacteraceae bacterium]